MASLRETPCPRKILPALFLLSCGVLLFETMLPPYLLLLRGPIFIILSLASVSFGLSLGSLVGARLSPSWCCLGATGAIVFFLITTLSLPPAWGIMWNLFVYAAALCLPFFFFGALVAQVLARSDCIGRTYGIHLLGASLGVAMGVCLLKPLGVERCFLLALLGSLAAAFYYRKQRPQILGCCLIAFLIPFLPAPNIVRLAKKLSHPQHKAIFKYAHPISHSRWDVTGHVAVGDLGQVFMNGLLVSEVAYSNTFDEHLAIPFYLYSHPKTLVLGPAGGSDLATARHFTKQVTGVEISPSIVEIMSHELETDVYRKAHILNMDGRAFLQDSAETFDVIMMTSVGGVGSQYGGLNLGSYLYTQEAFQELIRHLSPRGTLALGMSIKGGKLKRVFPPVDRILRILSTWTSLSLQDMEFHRKILLFSRKGFYPDGKEWNRGHLYFKKDGFSDSEVEETLGRIKALEKNHKIQLLYAPGRPGENIYSRLIRSAHPDAYQAFVAQSPEDISPITDDRPYLYQVERGRRTLKKIVALLGMLALFTLCLQGFAMRQGVHPRGTLQTILFFAALGSASLLLQLCLIQRFALLLGSLTVSFAAVVLAQLIMSSIGGWLSEMPWWDSALGRRLLPVSVLVSLGGLFWSFHSLNLAMALSFLLVSFLCTGLLFPTALARTQKVAPTAVPFAWGAGAAGALLGNALFLWTSHLQGLTYSFQIAWALYAGACVLWYRSRAPIALLQ